jgi:hypothetical protein
MPNSQRVRPKGNKMKTEYRPTGCPAAKGMVVTPIAQKCTPESNQGKQFLQSVGGTVFLPEPQEGTDQDDRQDNGCIDAIVQEERQERGEDQDHGDWAFKLGQ